VIINELPICTDSCYNDVDISDDVQQWLSMPQNINSNHFSSVAFAEKLPSKSEQTVHFGVFLWRAAPGVVLHSPH